MMRDERIARCPHCQQPLASWRRGVRLGPLAMKIYDAVERAGPDGISPADLFELTYKDREGASPARLKGYICVMNERLSEAGVAIRSNRQTYRLIALRQR